jgi:hypothetical protein
VSDKEKLTLVRQACFASEFARDALKVECANLRAKLAQAEQDVKHAEESEGEAWRKAESFREAAESLTVRVAQAERERDAAMKILSPLTHHDISRLLAKAEQLKGTDGEGWAVGELIERLCDHPHLFTPATGKEDGER